jgi:hypothetical protein
MRSHARLTERRDRADVGDIAAVYAKRARPEHRYVDGPAATFRSAGATRLSDCFASGTVNVIVRVAIPV